MQWKVLLSYMNKIKDENISFRSRYFFWKSDCPIKSYGFESRNLGHRVHFGSARLTTGTPFISYTVILTIFRF